MHGRCHALRHCHDVGWPQTPAEGEKRKEIMTRSGWLIILVIVLVAAWFAYTRTHPAPLPNFHW